MMLERMVGKISFDDRLERAKRTLCQFSESGIKALKNMAK